MAQEIFVRQLSQKTDPILYSQVLHLRNQLLRIPIGLDLFQEDLTQEKDHVTLAAITTGLAKSNDNNYNSIPSPSTNSKDIRRNHAEKREGGRQPTQQETEQKVVGCIILAPKEGDEKTLKVRQMAVSPDFQGQGLGSKLVDSAEDFAKREGKTRLYLHGRKPAVGFYEKKGFRQISGEEFLELGIPHYALEKMLLQSVYLEVVGNPENGIGKFSPLKN